MDIQIISQGESIELTPFLAESKLTIYDFYADWCQNCRVFDTHIGDYAAAHPQEIAYRKINIVDWESPVALKYLSQIDELPYAIVFTKKGKRFQHLSGLNKVNLYRLLDQARALDSFEE